MQGTCISEGRQASSPTRWVRSSVEGKSKNTSQLLRLTVDPVDYIGLALFAEGSSDHSFLRPVIRRLVEDVALRIGTRPVEVSEVEEVHSPPGAASQPRAGRINAAARSSADRWNVFFVHADADGNVNRALNERVMPGIELMRQSLGTNRRCYMPVVPCQAMEAWILADGETLRGVFSTRLSDAELGLPSSSGLERLATPKEALNQVFDRTVQRRRRRRRETRPSTFFAVIGEQIPLGSLRRVRQFQSLEQAVEECLRRLLA